MSKDVIFARHEDVWAVVGDSIKSGQWDRVVEYLRDIVANTQAPPEFFVHLALIDGIVAESVGSDYATSLLKAFRESEFERRAMPLVRALESVVEGPQVLDNMEPEGRRAAEILRDIIKDQPENILATG